jgi:hypothetical protein
MPTFFDGNRRTPSRAWSTRADQTVSFDDLLVGTLRCCTVCGRGAIAREGVWMAESSGPALAVAYGLCARCMGTVGESHAALDRKLRARYHIVEDDEDGHAA